MSAVVEPPAINIALPRSKTSSRNGNSHRFTLEEYFALNAASERRYEYDEGMIIPMAGTTAPHNRIAGNFYVAFDRAFEERDCEVYIEGMGFRVSDVKYRYPDVMAVCGTPVFDDNKPPCLLNPNVIVEVLSASTEGIDKGRKIDEYLRCSSVTDYLLVEQERVSVIHMRRQDADEWLRKEYTDLADTLTLASLGVSILLREVYRKIKFDTESEPQSG